MFKRMMAALVAAVMLCGPVQAADLSRVHTWLSGDSLHAVDLNAEFDNAVDGHNEQEDRLNAYDLKFPAGILGISSGGTGASTASTARTALGAAASGANSDITSLSALSTALSVTQGGTGLNSIIANRILYTSGVNTFAPLDISSTLGISSGTLSVQNNTSTQKIIVQKAGTTIGTRSRVNLIEGTNVTLTTSDNSTDDRVDVTVSATMTAGYPEGYYAGPPPTYTSAATITVPAGLMVRDSTNAVDIKVSSPLVVSLAASGALGLDTGAEASSTWYYVYLIKKADGTVSAVFSATNESVSGSITLPSGYIYKRQLRIAVRNDGSSNILPFKVVTESGAGIRVVYTQFEESATYRVLNAGTATSFTSVSCASLVPPVSQEAYLKVNTAFSSSGTSSMRISGSGVTTGFLLPQAPSGYNAVAMFNLATDSSQQVDYKQTAGQTVSIFIMGFTITEKIP